MILRMLWPCCWTGLAAALLLSLLQTFWVTPLILQAEVYESRADTVEHHVDAETDASADQAWQPENGWQRRAATFASNTVMAWGFSLMLFGGYRLRRPRHVWQGLAWGGCGYLAFFAAPALGLPPELPGTAAADLLARQAWWLTTATCTAAGLALLTLQQKTAWRITALALIAAPHLIGAPQLEQVFSVAPPALQQQFIIASTLSNLAFWLTLGGLSALLFHQSEQGNPHG